MIDISALALLDNPLNADLHEVVPGKLVAFRGPRDLNGRLYKDDLAKGTRSFSPLYYLSIFQSLGVSTVVRLNTPKYNPDSFKKNGIEHFDLYFQACTVPTADIIRRFLTIVQQARGLVAVHCCAGLGRTGTLIALYMMKHHGFSARQAIGWLRILRPGSVVGEQQHFLCSRRPSQPPALASASSESGPQEPPTRRLASKTSSRRLPLLKPPLLKTTPAAGPGATAPLSASLRWSDTASAGGVAFPPLSSPSRVAPVYPPAASPAFAASHVRGEAGPAGGRIGAWTTADSEVAASNKGRPSHRALDPAVSGRGMRRWSSEGAEGMEAAAVARPKGRT
jgi:hypothetical protein